MEDTTGWVGSRPHRVTPSPRLGSLSGASLGQMTLGAENGRRNGSNSGEMPSIVLSPCITMTMKGEDRTGCVKSRRTSDCSVMGSLASLFMSTCIWNDEVLSSASGPRCPHTHVQSPPPKKNKHTHTQTSPLAISRLLPPPVHVSFGLWSTWRLVFVEALVDLFGGAHRGAAAGPARRRRRPGSPGDGGVETVEPVTGLLRPRPPYNSSRV